LTVKETFGGSRTYINKVFLFDELSGTSSMTSRPNTTISRCVDNTSRTEEVCEEEVSLEDKIKYEHPMKERMRVQNELRESHSDIPTSRRYESDEEVKREKIRRIKKVMKSKTKSQDFEPLYNYNNTLEMNHHESEEDDRVIRSKSVLPERKVKERTLKSCFDNDYKSLEVQLRDMEEQLKTMSIERGYTHVNHSKSFSYLNNALSFDYGKKSCFMISYEEPKQNIKLDIPEDKQKVTMLEQKLDKLEKDVSEMKVNFEKLVETINKAIEANTLIQPQNNMSGHGYAIGYSRNLEYEQPYNDNNNLVSHILNECNRMINDHLERPHYSGHSSPKGSDKKEESFIDISFEKSKYH
jgi:hypothetical protein